jgi:uncharacterized protein (AIM24 family)
MTHALSLQDFAHKTAQVDTSPDVFQLESSKMLEVQVNGKVWCKAGSMVGRYGDVSFKREGMLERGLGHLLKKAVSGESTTLMKAEGRGRIYLADKAKEITLLRLNNESLFVNGQDVLAFEDSISHEITMMRRIASVAAGGLFNVKLSGSGFIAFTTHGKPLTLGVAPGSPLYTDPNATVAWSASLKPELTANVSFKTFIGRGSGESFQMKFEGSGIVVLQPYEETLQVSK